MIKCKITVDGYEVGTMDFTPVEIAGLNNEPGIVVEIVNE